LTTKLRSPFKREVAIAGDDYTLTITPDGFKLVPKGRRKGYELSWRALVTGDAALATALNASLKQVRDGPKSSQTASRKKRSE
jgi:hypothetical protein